MKTINLPSKVLKILYSPYQPPAVHCMLFDDMIPDQVCTIRKRELHGRGEFTCKDCKQR